MWLRKSSLGNIDRLVDEMIFSNVPENASVLNRRKKYLIEIQLSIQSCHDYVELALQSTRNPNPVFHRAREDEFHLLYSAVFQKSAVLEKKHLLILESSGLKMEAVNQVGLESIMGVIYAIR